MAGNSSLGHRDSLVPFQQFYCSLVPSLLFKSVFHTALGKKVYSKQKTINEQFVSCVLAPFWPTTAPFPLLYNSVQVSAPPGSLCWPWSLPALSTSSQSIWGPFLFGAQIKWVTSIMNVQLYYDLFSFVTFPNRMWALRVCSISLKNSFFYLQSPVHSRNWMNEWTKSSMNLYPVSPRNRVGLWVILSNKVLCFGNLQLSNNWQKSLQICINK